MLPRDSAYAITEMYRNKLRGDLFTGGEAFRCRSRALAMQRDFHTAGLYGANIAVIVSGLYLTHTRGILFYKPSRHFVLEWQGSYYDPLLLHEFPRSIESYLAASFEEFQQPAFHGLRAYQWNPVDCRTQLLWSPENN